MSYEAGKISALLAGNKKPVFENKALETLFSSPPPVAKQRTLSPNTDVGKKRSSKTAKETGSNQRREAVNKEYTSNTTEKHKKKIRTNEADVNQRTIFVGNLPATIVQKQLKKMFRKCGEVESMRFRSVAPANLTLPRKAIAVKRNLHPSRHNLNAYVVFKDVESVKSAIKMNGKEYEGFHLRVDVASNSSQHDNKRSVFVGNLPFDIEEDSVREDFEEFGHVENVRIIRDPKTGLGKGFGYVLFENVDGANLAQKASGVKVAGRLLRIERCVVKDMKHKPQDNSKGWIANSGVQQKETFPQRKYKRRTVPSNIKQTVFDGKQRKKLKKKRPFSVDKSKKQFKPKGLQNAVNALKRLKNKSPKHK